MMALTEQPTMLPVIDGVATEHQDVAPPRCTAPLLGSAFVLRCLAALASLGAAAIHAAQIEVHLTHWLPSGMFFIVLAALQAMAAPTVLVLRSRRADLGIILLSLGAVAAWVVSRTFGLPFGPARGLPEAIAVPDLVATTFEVVTGVSLALVCGTRMGRLERFVSRSRHGGWAVLASAITVASLTGFAIGPSGASHHSHATHGEEQRPISTRTQPVDRPNQHSDGCELLNTESPNDHNMGGAGTGHAHAHAHAQAPMLTDEAIREPFARTVADERQVCGGSPTS